MHLVHDNRRETFQHGFLLGVDLTGGGIEHTQRPQVVSLAVPKGRAGIKADLGLPR